MSAAAAAAATAHSFNKILNQPKVSSKSRSSGDLDDGTKKLRRMILVDGIPSSVVCQIRSRLLSWTER
jgi:cell cycle arrest protein BUB2